MQPTNGATHGHIQTVPAHEVQPGDKLMTDEMDLLPVLGIERRGDQS
jgi:hypothetical protein